MQILLFLSVIGASTSDASRIWVDLWHRTWGTWRIVPEMLVLFNKHVHHRFRLESCECTGFFFFFFFHFFLWKINSSQLMLYSATFLEACWHCSVYKSQKKEQVLAPSVKMEVSQHLIPEVAFPSMRGGGGEPAVSYRWTGWIWEITDHFRGIYRRIYHNLIKGKSEDVNM